MLDSLRSLSLSGDSWPNYVRLGWGAGNEELCFPPTTHLIATVDDLTDVLNFDSEDIEGIDDDAGEEQEPPPTRRRTASSSYGIYMVDTPKETNVDEATGENPSGKKAKHGHHRCRSKPRHNNIGTGEEKLDGTQEEYDPDQPTFEQAA